jgi:signal transduction histidine kinase
MSTPDPQHGLTELLFRLSECGYDSEDPKWVLDHLIQEVARHFCASSGSISLFNPNHNSLEIEAYHGLPENCSDWKLPMGVGLTGWVALHHRSLRVDDVRQDNRYVKIIDSVRSALAVPLVDSGQSIGVLTIESDQIARFTTEDQTALEMAANIIVRVVAKVWRVAHLKKKCGQLESLVTIVGKVSNRFELEGILFDLTREARKILECRMCSLFLVTDPGVLELEILVDEQGVVQHEERLAFEESSMGTAATHRKTIEVHHLAYTEEYHFRELASTRQLIGMLSTPMVYENRVIGVLNAYTTTPHRFSNTEKGIFQALANIGALAIENSKLYNRIIDSEDALRSNERLTTLGLLAAEIAHEIRNPLTVIRLLVESLSLDLDLDREKLQDLNIVLEKINELGEIVGRVLNFGKSQQQIFLRWDLNSIVLDSIQLIRFKLQRNRIRVEFEPGNAVNVNCHKGQIQQVLLNLFINAEEAMPEGGSIRVQISQDPVKGQAILHFKDSGQGIPESIRAHIFDSFLSGKPTGSGLGLAIVKRILRDHRGDISIQETGPRGTTFCFWLPLMDT